MDGAWDGWVDGTSVLLRDGWMGHAITMVWDDSRLGRMDY